MHFFRICTRLELNNKMKLTDVCKDTNNPNTRKVYSLERMLAKWSKSAFLAMIYILLGPLFSSLLVQLSKLVISLYFWNVLENFEKRQFNLSNQLWVSSFALQWMFHLFLDLGILSCNFLLWQHDNGNLIVVIMTTMKNPDKFK